MGENPLANMKSDKLIRLALAEILMRLYQKEPPQFRAYIDALINALVETVEDD